jgi:hypothetical protein
MIRGVTEALLPRRYSPGSSVTPGKMCLKNLYSNFLLGPKRVADSKNSVRLDHVRSESHLAKNPLGGTGAGEALPSTVIGPRRILLPIRPLLILAKYGHILGRHDPMVGRPQAPAWQACPWGHSPSSSAPCAVPTRLSRIGQHINDEPCAKQRAFLGIPPAVS